MDFKHVKTYGRFRNRVIKTDLWISPQVQRNRLFVSTSSESSSNSSGNRSKKDSTVSVGGEQVNENSRSGIISSDESITSKDKILKSLSNNYNRQNPSRLSSLDTDNNSPVVTHSTPFSSRCHVTVNSRRLPVISPLVSESPVNRTVSETDSPNLFSDASQEHSNPSTNENVCDTTNDDEVWVSTDSENGASCNAANESEDSCSTTNGNEKSSHHSCNIDRMEDLNDKDSSLKNELLVGTQFMQNTCANNESHTVKRHNNQNTNTEDSLTKTQNLTKENHPIYLASDFLPKNQSANVHDMSKEHTSLDSNDTFDDGKNLLRYKHHPNLEDVSEMDRKGGEPSNKHLSREVQSISSLVKCTSLKNESTTIWFDDKKEHISDKGQSNVLHNECNKNGGNATSNHKDPLSTKPVHSTKQALNMDNILKKMKEFHLLDAKVYLDKKEGLKSSTPHNSMNGVDAKFSEDANPGKGSKNDQPPLPSSDVHLLLTSCPLPAQQKSDKLCKKRYSKEITPKNIDIYTPMSSQYTGEIVKNPNYSSFVEALTPASFQQSRMRPLSPKQKILVQCEQEKPLKFTEVLAPRMLAKCVKVGEGTYGEVYKTNDGVEDVALKVVPIEGNFTVNDEQQKSFAEIIPEIVISKELSRLADGDDMQNAAHVCSNFIKVKRVMLVQDSYPDKLLHEWDKWKEDHNCENERPDMFESDQYFVVFEFTDGGEDLETFQFSSMNEALSVLQQVALSLSVAEKSLMFEHRDLHWGNVLIKRSKCKTIRYKLCGRDIYVKSAGVFVSIIDFTLSRLIKDGVTVYCDLSKDPDIFKGKGDYQFQVYRLMRKANNNNWENHKPYSNVLWLRYLIDKILNAKKYKKPNNNLQRNIRTHLRQVLSYESAMQAVQDGFLGIDFPPDC